MFACTGYRRRLTLMRPFEEEHIKCKLYGRSAVTRSYHLVMVMVCGRHQCLSCKCLGVVLAHYTFLRSLAGIYTDAYTEPPNHRKKKSLPHYYSYILINYILIKSLRPKIIRHQDNTCIYKWLENPPLSSHLLSSVTAPACSSSSPLLRPLFCLPLIQAPRQHHTSWYT
jgi:hypothetical protein